MGRFRPGIPKYTVPARKLVANFHRTPVYFVRDDMAAPRVL